MKNALRAEEVLCGDETPANVIRKDTGPDGKEAEGAPHAVTTPDPGPRTPDARLIWYAAMRSRSSASIAGLGRESPRRPAGGRRRRPGRPQDGQERLSPALRAGLRARYDEEVAWGITTNRHRDWPRGHHPGYNLAIRLQRKAAQVWLFTSNFSVPWTNNASEQAVKGPKRHQAVSGYWHTHATLGDYCRIRSYLLSARGHGNRATDAIHTALDGKPWLPVPAIS